MHMKGVQLKRNSDYSERTRIKIKEFRKLEKIKDSLGKGQRIENTFLITCTQVNDM